MKTRVVKVGDIKVGGGNPVIIQSMTKTDTRDVKATVQQIKKLEKAGCEIVRVAVPDLQAAEAIKEIKKKIKIPLVADIHFDYQLALAAIRSGADKIRINPGNMPADEVKEVCEAVKKAKIPVRIGVNTGSLKKVKNLADDLVDSALENVKLVEKFGVKDIVVSAKATDVETTVKVYRELAKKTNYPLHLGVTEAGTFLSGTVKSSMAIGTLLQEGIGDTIRVSLSADPVEEVRVAQEILQDLGLRQFRPEIITCPGCGRAEVDIWKLAKRVENTVKDIKKPLKIAVMGCVVNGIGEGKMADFAVVGGKKCGLIMKKGEIVLKNIAEKNLMDELVKVLKSENLEIS
ncbi:MAG TPA: flavodoxin-dependent (E)-4-hydroxy-3-methylbut-2-enyl-diphosphate synthase [Candidatus Peregrinibacteria bacterium]|nr:flavodoxin-dependent (E)-4-hydroxy-3-methylbut-2-enyl-diphosphate synthase [Candidatus Peregrinibacteria bacterium]